MLCRSCGSDLPSEANYCPECGARVVYTPLQDHSTPLNKTLTATPTIDLSFKRRVPNRRTLVGFISLLLILVVSGIFVFSTHRAQSNKQASNPLPNPYPPYKGTLIINNPLSENNNGYYFWQEDNATQSTSSCGFSGGSFHVTQLRKGFTRFCFATGNFSDFAYQIEMTIIKGDGGGIAFRLMQSSFYYFAISIEGLYVFSEYDNTRHVLDKLLSRGSISVFHKGFNQSNLVAVVAEKSTIDLYVNLHHIISVSNAIYNKGQIGVLAKDDSSATEVVFRNAKLWTL